MRKDLFVSVISVLHNDFDILEDFLKECHTALNENFSHYEILLIDNGSSDNTWKKIDDLLKQVDCVRYVRLSRFYDYETAVSAGLETVIGDYVVVLDPDTDHPSLIPGSVERAQLHEGIIFGVRENRNNDTLLVRFGARMFHWYIEHILKFSIPKNTTNLRVLTRKAINALIKIKDTNRYLRLLETYTGLPSETMLYKQTSRRGTEKAFTFTTHLRHAKNIIIGNSLHPLRIVALLGLVASLANLAYILYVIVIYLFKPDVAQGWTTTSLQISFMFFLLFLILAVLSEYVGEILRESKNRPSYLIIDEKTSSVLLGDQERRNVTHDSLL